MKSNIMVSNEEVQQIGDRRKLRRFSERLEIGFNVDGVEHRGLLTNFSLSGLFIETNYSFRPGILLDITIYLPNNLTSHLKGKIVRASNETLCGVSGKATGYAEKGIGIELIQEDTLYLHFIRSFVSAEGKRIFRRLAFTEQDERYQRIKAELQEKCRLFDIVAVAIGEDSKQSGIKGRAWLEAKIKNNTDYVFEQPVVTFITTKNSEHAQNGKGKSPPEIGTMLMSSSDDLSHWKPGETIMLDGDIDPLSEDIPTYELKFFDYLTKIPEFAFDFPLRINDYVSTLWIGSPCLSETDENIRDNIPCELLQPSLPAHEGESGIADFAKSDDTASEDFLPPPSPQRIGLYNSFGNNFRHEETDTNKIPEKDESVSPIGKWILFLGLIIIASLSVFNFLTDKGTRQSFERQTPVVSSQKGIAPEKGTERKEADLRQQKKQENRQRAERKTPRKNKQNADSKHTRTVRLASVNKDLQSSQSTKRRRQPLPTAGGYSIQIGLRVYKHGRGTVTDMGGGALIDCGSICSTLVKGALYLTATPDGGSVFIKWSGCDRVDVNKVCMVNMVSKDRAVTAIFRENPESVASRKAGR
jgi:hypothetical protein